MWNTFDPDLKVLSIILFKARLQGNFTLKTAKNHFLDNYCLIMRVYSSFAIQCKSLMIRL